MKLIVIYEIVLSNTFYSSFPAYLHDPTMIFFIYIGIYTTNCCNFGICQDGKKREDTERPKTCNITVAISR